MRYVGQIQQAVLTIAPWFLRNANVGRLLESMGLELDGGLAATQLGFDATEPLRCDPSALPTIAGDRGIRLYPMEPLSSKRYRVAHWWQIRKLYGSPLGILRNLQPYFLPGPLPRMHVVYQAGDGVTSSWHTIDPDGTYHVRVNTALANWNWDDLARKWARFWVIVELHSIGITDWVAHWDDAGIEWDDGVTHWDAFRGPNGYYYAPHFDDMRDAILDAKAGHSHFWGLILSFDPGILQPDQFTRDKVPSDGTWGVVTLPTTGQPSRPAGASFLFDQGYT